MHPEENIVTDYISFLAILSPFKSLKILLPFTTAYSQTLKILSLSLDMSKVHTSKPKYLSYNFPDCLNVDIILL